MYKIIAFILLISSYALASEKDSLLQISKAGTYKDQVLTNIRLSVVYRNNQPDSALYYLNNAYQIATKEKLDTQLFTVYNHLAITYKLKGEYDTTRYFFKLCLQSAVNRKDSSDISSTYNNMGVFYEDLGEQSKALDFFLKAAEIYEKQNNMEGMAVSFNNIGLIHYKMEDFEKAKKYYENSLALRIELHDTDGIALLYNNLGIIFYFENKVEKCLDYFKKAAKIWEKSNNKRQTAMVLSNIGELYFELQIYQTAMNYLKESQKIYSFLGDVQGEISVLNLLGEVYQEWGKLDLAKDYYLKAYKAAQSIDAKIEMVDVVKDLAQVYKTLGDYKTSNFYLSLYVEKKDSLLNAEKTKSMQELQTKYETEKKEQEIKLLNNINQLNETQINKQKIVTISLIIGLILILVVVVLSVRQSRLRKRSNELLQIKNDEITEQNQEILSQNEEILAQRDEIEVQRDLVEIQKSQIELIHQHVSQSIDYAERIQNSALPNHQILKSQFDDYFVFLLPRDVVSGDFYWWANIENQTVITAADSTGHGVPGAFMSMLGMSLLKEIVVKGYITHPGVILRKLRKEIINTLKQKGEIGEQKDGMDMSLISFNHDNNMLQYSGANNPLYIIRKHALNTEYQSINKFQIKGSESFLYEIKPDKMPIAIYDNMDKFTTHELQLEKGDQVYMFSDGFSDQFGGSKNKKFKYKPFKKLLLEISNQPMSEQREILKSTFFDWKGNYEQVDDVVIIGIKI